jgi:hypothetical protein
MFFSSTSEEMGTRVGKRLDVSLIIIFSVLIFVTVVVVLLSIWRHRSSTRFARVHGNNHKVPLETGARGNDAKIEIIDVDSVLQNKPPRPTGSTDGE